MKRIGVRELRDHATKYLAGDEVLAIERHGRPVGYYVPAGPHARVAETNGLPVWEGIAQRMMAETGLSEDELADLFDLSKPLPAELPRGRKATA